MTPKIVMFTQDKPSSNMVYHYLQSHFDIDKVIMEKPVSKWKIIRGRIKKQGVVTVIGQVLFVCLIVPILDLVSKKRQSEIRQKASLDCSAISDKKIINVLSINSPDVLEILNRLKPEIIVVNGTRIISEKILSHISGTILNMHAGVTPKYRGVHGAYWALADKDSENCGVTVHQVDAGIDTGNIVAQKIISPSHLDNFKTYPLLQTEAGLPLLKRAIESISKNKQNSIIGSGESVLRYHPTIWQYLINRLISGVK